VLTRGEPVSITVVNRLPEPTAVHWHGIELESYFDGVAGFGGVGRRISPAVAARDSFEARFTPPRAGTFIYHTHVDEERQQPAGLAGPLLVVEPGQRLDPATDLVVLITSPNDSASDNGGLLVNGRRTPAPLELRAGVPHRLRIINMALRRAGPRVEMRRDGAAVTWRPLAKDGHDLPAERQTERPARQIVSIGETYDMEVTPAAPGDLELGVFFGRSDVRLATLPVRVR
jgi:FtsP/CotA-like multicopper oxidase with cupredoxin domain